MPRKVKSRVLILVLCVGGGVLCYGPKCHIQLTSVAPRHMANVPPSPTADRVMNKHTYRKGTSLKREKGLEAKFGDLGGAR